MHPILVAVPPVLLETATEVRLPKRDDVVTRGSTMMSCILKLRENYPDIEVQGFALARVEEAELQEPSQMLSPKVETVIYAPSATPILVRSSST